MMTDCVAGETIEGVVDDFQLGQLRGWARRQDIDSQPLTIEIWQDDGLVATTIAAHHRADLALAGKGRGYCAFEVSVTLLSQSPLRVFALMPGSDAKHELGGSPFTVPPGIVRTLPEVFPVPLNHVAGIHGSIDQLGPFRLRGWAYQDNAGPLKLDLLENGTRILQVQALDWRADVAQVRQSNGACGFDVALPEALCDGELHRLTLCDAASGQALAPPLVARCGQAASTNQLVLPAPLVRGEAPPTMQLSIIVVFYNMPREAARTLTSLSRAYQGVGEDFSYEVICVDNGSSPAMDADWLATFGPQFRLIRPSPAHPSPCNAINQAALSAKGRYLGIMIDGAHVLSPGVFRQATAAWREDPDAVVALRHWFIGGDQRWLAKAGYRREQEDQLFERIQWPSNGYELFRISTPIGEGAEPWFEAMNESNCLLLPRALYDQIGGLDEGFDEPGGGFANLDLWGRAADAAKGQLIALIGEASFHQFHEGTTTNVEDAEKDRRVRRYAMNYQRRRGRDFTGVHRLRLNFRGRLYSEFCTGVRQRPLMPVANTITSERRRGDLAGQFDDGAQAYLQSVYAECDLADHCRWRELPTGVAPADLIHIQQLIGRLRPDAVVMVNLQPGLVRFVADMQRLLGLPGTRLIEAAQTTGPREWASQIIVQAQLNPHSSEAVAQVRHALVASERVMVLYAAGDADQMQVAEALAGYAQLVSHRSYLIYLDTVYSQPWLGYAKRHGGQLIDNFVAEHRDFAVDRSWNTQLISSAPRGYLHRAGSAAHEHRYDASLDDLAAYARSGDFA